MDITKILRKYTEGEATVEETNEALKKAGSSLRIDPMKNVITEDDLKVTTVGFYPEQANGYGLLDTGTGTLDKVHVVNGKLDYPVNSVDENGECHSVELVHICGRVYRVIVDKLVFNK